MNMSVRLRLCALVGLCLYVWIISTAAAGEQDAITRSSGGFQSERAEGERRDPATLETSGSAAESSPAKESARAEGRKHVTPCCAFRIYDARTWLYDDFDGDGHYTYLRVSFDIDTDYFEADVFVRLFLRGSDGRWSMIFESNVFPIFGTSATDDYEVETELVSGFPRDDYDVLIEVYEAPFGDLVVEYGPFENPGLGFLPLEDIPSDGALPPSVAVSSGGGGGALTYELLMLMTLVGWAMLRRRWSDPRQADEGTQRHTSHFMR